MRPDFQLFAHILGATALFGAMVAVALLAWTARRRVERGVQAQASFWLLIALALPAWVLMLAFGSWTKSKEEGAFSSAGLAVPDWGGWLTIGVGIAQAGIVVLLVAAAAAYSWKRRPASTWQPLLIGVLTTAYIGALAVAWWVMTTKLPN
jgi:heme A synthase